jgi:hypothetical protein
LKKKKLSFLFQEQSNMSSQKIRPYYFDLLRDISTKFVRMYFHILLEATKI